MKGKGKSVTVDNVGISGVSFGVLPFPQFHPTNILHFSIPRPTPCHFTFSFIHVMSYHFTPHSLLGVIVWFVAPLVYTVFSGVLDAFFYLKNSS